MYVAMNRFRVRAGREAEFEAIWKNRNSKLAEMPGFVSFHLLRGALKEAEGFRQYVSHSVWEDEERFAQWTRSQNFRDAHRNAGDNRDLYLGPPDFEGYSAVEGA